MFSVVFFMFYICVICDCVCVLKYAIYLIWPRQFSFGPCFFNLAHTLARTKNEPEGTLHMDFKKIFFFLKLHISTVQYCLKLQNINYCIVNLKKHL